MLHVAGPWLVEGGPTAACCWTLVGGGRIYCCMLLDLCWLRAVLMPQLSELFPWRLVKPRFVPNNKNVYKKMVQSD